MGLRRGWGLRVLQFENSSNIPASADTGFFRPFGPDSWAPLTARCLPQIGVSRQPCFHHILLASQSH